MSCFSALAAVTYSKDDKQKSEVIPVESDELEQKGYNSPSLGSHFFAQNEPIINYKFDRELAAFSEGSTTGEIRIDLLVKKQEPCY